MEILASTMKIAIKNFIDAETKELTGNLKANGVLKLKDVMKQEIIAGGMNMN